MVAEKFAQRAVSAPMPVPSTQLDGLGSRLVLTRTLSSVAYLELEKWTLSGLHATANDR